MRRPNRSKCSSDLWRPEALWRSRATGLWFGSTNARITRSFAKPRWIGNAHQSHGWEDCAWFSSILESSDKGKTVIDFLAAEIGVQRPQHASRLSGRRSCSANCAMPGAPNPWHILESHAGERLVEDELG